MTVSIFQLNKETYCWTLNELEELQSKDSNVFKFEPPVNGPYTFSLHNADITVYPNKVWKIQESGFDIDTLSDINVLVLYGVVRNEPLDVLLNEFRKHSDKKFILIGKHTEDYWISNSLMQNTEVLDTIGTFDNVRVIWDIDLPFKNFIFNPKVLFHNYHNQPTFQSGAIFEYGYDIFKRFDKRYRVGFHINKRTTKVRKFLYKYLGELKHPQLFFTSTDTFKSNIFDTAITPLLDSGNITENWYLKQFIEMTLYSKMEIVYETSTHNVSFPHLIKWNEKTIKLLFLGKPFIHSDMISHSLLKVFGIQPYESLYTPQLLDFYNSFSHKENLQTEDIQRFSDENYTHWLSLLQQNIDWLLGMDENEFNSRIEIANDIAEKNRLHIHNLIYNTSLLPLIISDNIWQS
jgi:hypothetical protein